MGAEPEEQLTGVVGVGVSAGFSFTAEAGQAVVGDLQDKAVVHHTVGRLEFPVRHDDTVVEKQHPLEDGGTT